MTKQVFIVDDDGPVRQSVVRLLRSENYAVTDFASAQAFLDAPLPEVPACLILDMRLSTTSSGFDVLDALALKNLTLPTIFVTAYGSIPMTVRAMKAGACEFLTKPIRADALLRAVGEALQLAEQNLERHHELRESTRRYATLTPREKDVLGLAIGGLMNKQIATELGIQEVTAKVHKQKVMEKMGTKSLADLVRIAERLRILSPKSRYQSGERDRLSLS